MTADRITARDEAYAVVLGVGNSAVDVLGYVPAMRWLRLADPKSPVTEVWFRTSFNVVDNRQSTLSTFVGKPGQKRYTAVGFVMVQLYMSKADDSNADLGEIIAKRIQNAFRNARSECGIMYRHIRVVDVDQESLFYRLNVVAEFEYDEVNKE